MSEEAKLELYKEYKEHLKGYNMRFYEFIRTLPAARLIDFNEYTSAEFEMKRKKKNYKPAASTSRSVNDADEKAASTSKTIAPKSQSKIKLK
jgi:hypothetical protein